MIINRILISLLILLIVGCTTSELEKTSIKSENKPSIENTVNYQI